MDMSTIEELQIGYSLGYLGSGYLEGVHLHTCNTQFSIFMLCTSVFIYLFYIHYMQLVDASTVLSTFSF